MRRLGYVWMWLTVMAGCSGVNGPLSATRGGAAQPDWQVYTDSRYDFSVSYPPAYVILPESSFPLATRPPVLHRVRFQRADIAAGAFADREPAQFAVVVYARDADQPLRQWLERAGLVPADAEVSAVKNAAFGDGVRVQRRQQIAPNETVYFADPRFVYGLVPLGEHGPAMVGSFRR